MKGGEDLQKAIAKLDENGWNTEEKLYAATTTRAHGLLAIVLNEVLELSLGDPAECTNIRIKLVYLPTTFPTSPDSMQISDGPDR
jgi:hypothetical protein